MKRSRPSRGFAAPLSGLCGAALLLSPGVSAWAQSSDAAAAGTGYSVSGSIRVRGEDWRWFRTPGFNDHYVFGGALARLEIARSEPRLDQHLELAAPVLVGLPANATAAAPLGPLGMGANYRVANNNSAQVAQVFPKQAFLRFKGRSGAASSSLRIGRFEFWDGGEVVPRNAALALLKRDHINHRLIGNFGFTHVGRSFDGVQYVLSKPGISNLNLMAMRTTEGVFQANGWGEVDGVGLLYGAYTRSVKDAEARVFAIQYRDDRRGLLSIKADNRPLSVRAADQDRIGITTLGGHYIRTLEGSSGITDLLAWGALQTGDWGSLSHHGTAIALEAGYQPRHLPAKPWLRLGYFRSSGDGNPNDRRHNTFFSILPTPRIYARTPFYNQMNNEDISASAILRPAARLTVRADIHRLRLSQGADQWYNGGGAFQDDSFGYAGRPNSSRGSRDLATLFDISIDHAVSSRSSLSLYFSRVRGGPVMQGIYADRRMSYTYLEMTQKF